MSKGYGRVERAILKILAEGRNWLGLDSLELRRTDGTQRVETFRVRRIYEIERRKRFVCMECQIEVAQ